MEIKEKGKLNVDGGRAQRPGYTYMLGGGAGGIIQIISPEGSIATGTLSLKGGDKFGKCKEAEHGYITVSSKSSLERGDNNSETFNKNVKNCYILVPGNTITILQSYTRYFYLNEALTLISNLASLTNQSRCCSVSLQHESVNNTWL